VPIFVIENSIDFDLFAPVRKHRKKETVTIGWAGTATHEIDYQHAFSALVRVLHRHKNLFVEFWGGHIPSPIARGLERGIGQGQVGVRSWVPIHQYPAWLSAVNWDLSLAPLQFNEFNRAKSALKLIEAGALKIPCLASNVCEYKRFCEANPKLQTLLCSSSDEWEEKLERFVSNEELRVELGEELHREVKERHLIQHRIPLLRKIFAGEP
ncbi:MAG: glycosyltransferase, partial [Patescibacteria group bacterium]|nr:glycosyltransferase [Patescibacteria group bacterium]